MPFSRFPYFNQPGFYRNSYYSTLYNNNFYKPHNHNTVSRNRQNLEYKKKYSPLPKDDLKNEYIENEENLPEKYFFEIFGLKLYFDDILLICLIFFLYQEGVKDDELFISLVLLLLS